MMTDTPEEVRQARLTGERAEFFAHDTVYVDTIFADGESPLKHARNVELVDCAFQWKYPLRYAKDVTARGCTWFEMGRAGVWYTNDIDVVDCTIEAPKNVRRCDRVTLRDTDLTHADETLWHCSNVTLDNVVARGDYLAMDCSCVTADRLRLVGNYPFDGVTNPLSGVIRADHIGELTLDPDRIDPSRTVIDTREGLVMSDIAASTVAPSFA